MAEEEPQSGGLPSVFSEDEDPQAKIYEYLVDQAVADPTSSAMKFLEKQQAEVKSAQAERAARFASQPELLAAMEAGEKRATEQIDRLNKLAKSQGLSPTADNRSKLVSDLYDRVLNATGPVTELDAPLSDDEFNVMNIVAQRSIGKSYGDAVELSQAFPQDALTFSLTMQPDIKQSAPAKYAVRDGEVISSTGQRPSEEELGEEADNIRAMLERLPEDSVWANIAREQKRRKNSTKEENDLVEEIAFKNDPVGRIRYREMSMANTSQARTALAANIMIPVYDDPTGRTSGIDLEATEKGLKGHYTALLIRNRHENELSNEEIEAEAQKRATADIARISKASGEFGYRSDDRELESFLKGETTAGKIANAAPILYPWMALTIGERKTAGEYTKEVINDKGESTFVVEEAFRPGGLEWAIGGAENMAGKLVPGESELSLANTSVTRGADSVIRYSTSEALGALFNLALKDYARTFGQADTPDKQNHRAGWLTKHMPTLWTDPRLALEIASGTDNAGRLLTQFGGVMLGAAGTEYPFWANLATGVPWFLFMLSVADANPISALPYTLKAAKTAKAGAEATAVKVGLTPESVQYDSMVGVRDKLRSIMVDGKLDPVQATKILEDAAKSDPNFAAAWEIQRRDIISALSEVSSKVGSGKTNVIQIHLAKLQAEGKNLVKNQRRVESALEAAKVTKNAAEADRAVVESVKGVFDLFRNKLNLFQAELQAQRAKMLVAQRQLAGVRALDTISGGSKASRAELTRLIKSGELDEVLKANNLEGAKLLDEMAELFNDAARADKSLNDARKAFLRRMRSFVKSDIRTTLRTKEASLIATINKSLSRQSGLVKEMEDFVKSTKSIDGTLDERTVLDQLSNLMTTVQGDEFLRLAASVPEAMARAEKAALEASDTIRPLLDELKILRAGNAAGKTSVTDEALQEVSGIILETLDRSIEAMDILRTNRGRKALRSALGVSNAADAAEEAEFVVEMANLRTLGGKHLNAMSDTEFFAAIQEAENMTLFWNSLPMLTRSRVSAFLTGGAAGKGLGGTLLAQTATWVAIAKVMTTSLLETFPVFKLRVSLVSEKYAEVIKDACVKTANMSRIHETDLALIITKGAANEVDDKIVQYLGGNQRIYLSGRTLPVSEGASIAKNRRFELTGNVGLGRSLVDMAIKSMAGAGRYYLGGAKAADDAAKVARETPQATLALRGFLHSFIKDDIADIAVGKIDEAVVLFAKALAEAEDDILAITDPAIKFRALQDAAINALKKKKIPSHIKVSSIPQRSRNLSYRAVLAGAASTSLAERIAVGIGGTLTLRNSRAYRILVEGEKAAGLSSRSTIEIGDMVILNNEARAFRSALYGPKGADKAEGLRKPLSPALEAAMTKRATSAGIDVPVARRLEKIETVDGETVAVLIGKQGVEKVPLSMLSKHEPEMSWLDFVDVLDMFGPKLIQSAYKVSWKNGLEEARAAYARMVVHSQGPDGRLYMVPEVDMGAFSKSSANLIKDLNVNIDSSLLNNPVTLRLLDHTKKVLSTWRAAVTVGLGVAAKPAFMFFVWSGDTVQMLVRDGPAKAIMIGGYGSLGYIPGVGPLIQDGVLRGVSALAKATGVEDAIPLPSMFTSVFNRFLDDVYKGVDEVREYTLANGKVIKVNPAVVRHELNISPLESGFRTEDWFLMTEALARKTAQAAGPGYAGRKMAVQAADGTWRFTKAGLSAYRETIDVALRAGNRRQREMYMIDEVFNKGKSWDQARDQLRYTLYDYQRSIGKFEANLLASYSAFYTYMKNFTITSVMDLFHGSDDLVDYSKRLLKLDTRQQRMIGLSRFSDTLRPGEYTDASQVFTPEEARRLIAEKSVPDYYENYLTGNSQSLSPEAKALAKELGQPWEQYAFTYGSPLPAVEALSIFGSVTDMLSAYIAAKLSDENVFASEEATEAFLDGFLNTANPLAEAMIGNHLRKLAQVPPSRYSTLGKPLSGQEMALIDFMDNSGFEWLRLKAGIDPTPGSEKDPRVRSTDFLTNSGILRLVADGYDRTRLLGTIAFGRDFAPDRLLVLSSEEATPEQKEKKARMVAFLELMGVMRLRMWRGDLQQSYRVSDDTRLLREEAKAMARGSLGQERLEARRAVREEELKE